jgi:hypothetical protein
MAQREWAAGDTFSLACTWKEGGVSKAGKPYDGFYKCGEKNPDQSFCTQRPPR